MSIAMSTTRCLIVLMRIFDIKERLSLNYMFFQDSFKDEDVAVRRSP